MRSGLLSPDPQPQGPESHYAQQIDIILGTAGGTVQTTSTAQNNCETPGDAW
jgi:hypothetical protein